MENVFFEQYGLHHELLNSIINISTTEIDKDYREEYIKYHINFISLKEDILVIINQFHKYTEIKKELDIKKFEDIKLQLKYYIILANTFIILYAQIIKNEYQYEIGFIPNHIFKKRHIKITRIKKKKKKKWGKHKIPDIENQNEIEFDTPPAPPDKLPEPSPNNIELKEIEIENLADSKESIDDIMNAVSNPSNETDSLNDTNSIISDDDPLSWNKIEIDNFKKKYGIKNYFRNDCLFEDCCGSKFMDTFWDKETALELLKIDMAESKEVSKRWSSDMKSDSWLSKNTRPLTLVFLTVSTVFLVLLDSNPPKLNWKCSMVKFSQKILAKN